jgi:hypothetical protein
MAEQVTASAVHWCQNRRDLRNDVILYSEKDLKFISQFLVLESEDLIIFIFLENRKF